MNLESLDFAVSKVMYQVYSWLGWRGVPSWVLDLFLPFLCYKTTPVDVFRDVWLHPQGLVVRTKIQSSKESANK